MITCSEKADDSRAALDGTQWVTWHAYYGNRRWANPVRCYCFSRPSGAQGGGGSRSQAFRSEKSIREHVQNLLHAFRLDGYLL
jgi:hypothetical protein